MAKKVGRFEKLQSQANSLNLYVARAAPGDGVTRYRFMKSRKGKPISYYRSSGEYTALGIKEAEAWLRGYLNRRR